MTIIDHGIVETSTAQSRRLLVTLRPVGEGDGPSPYRAVGFLTCDPEGYEFAYLPSAQADDSFVPIAGFGEVGKTYRSIELFPAFAQRVMSAHRPDRPRFLEAIDLREDSEPWEVLSRSGGRRGGDTIEVMEEPFVQLDGTTMSTFLVHGVRHQSRQATDRIAQLRPDDRLQLRLELDNPVNRRAVLVTADEDLPLGHVPDPLVEYVNRVMTSDHDVRVVRANGPSVAPHLRLLVKLTGKVEAGYRPFGL